MADDHELFTAVVEAGKPVTTFSLDVSGVQTLCLRSETVAPDDIGVHVDWVDTAVHVASPNR